MANLKFEIRDPVYGFISYNELERSIIDSYPFQRLRKIQQLALTHYIYPGATHTRFSHSLGVMHIATLMFNSIINKEPNRQILKEAFDADLSSIDRMLQIVRLSALLHDIGHAPFSHAAEDVMPYNDSTASRYEHEDYTIAVIKGPIKELLENSRINSFGIRVDDITDLIEGKSTSIGAFGVFWKSLISSQLDADRADYLLRDSHHCGVKYGIYDYQRLINTLELGYESETSDVKYGINKESWQIAEAFVLARYQISTQVYYHKTRRAFDYHLKNALNYLYKDNPFPPPEKIEEYLLMDEHSVWELLKKERDQQDDCNALYYRKQDRPVFSSSENITEPEEKRLAEICDLLRENSIGFHVDEIGPNWYKKDKVTEFQNIEPKEIMVIEENGRKASPLAIYSILLNNIKSFKQSRIYVKLDDKETVKKLIKGKYNAARD